MPQLEPLYEYIGDPVVVIAPSTSSSDGISASDCAAGVSIDGYRGVLFIEIRTATDANDASQVQIQFSTTGNASDAVTSNASYTATDAVFAAGPAASSPLISMLHFDVAAKGMETGSLFASIAAAETGGAEIGLIGIPYGGTRLLPATNAVTVVDADA